HSLVISALTSFLFHDSPTTQIYTLSLHDALPISVLSPLYALSRLLRSIAQPQRQILSHQTAPAPYPTSRRRRRGENWHETINQTDRKSTRLNSSHLGISYAVFCLKKKTPTKLHAI